THPTKKAMPEKISRPPPPTHTEKQKTQPPKAKPPSKAVKNTIVLENFLKKVYNFLKNEHSTIYAGRYT
ncbi:MAG: hypothetical protein J6X67_06030, partial [Treponema sp.]|nr:hypothetical protein [Treponema sp.]